MRIPVSVILALLANALLAGCGTSQPDEAASPRSDVDVATTAAPAPSGPAISPGDALATAAQDYAAGEVPLALVDGQEDPSSRSFDVIDCNEETRAADPSGTKPRRDEVVARRVALLRRSLKLIGYRPAVVDEPLAAYAADAARTSDPGHDEDGYARLAAALEARRAALQPELPPIRAEGGCGAAETPIVVKTRPTGGRVWLMTKFAFDLCRARRIDPWDRIACDRWSEVGPDRPVQLSGNYAYQARWPDGRSARGTRRIDPVADEDDGDEPAIITVDQQ